MCKCIRVSDQGQETSSSFCTSTGQCKILSGITAIARRST